MGLLILPLVAQAQAAQAEAPPPAAPGAPMDHAAPEAEEGSASEGPAGPRMAPAPTGGLGTDISPPKPEPVDNGVIDGRVRPGYVAPLPPPVTQHNEGAVRAPPPQAFPADQVPIPDRWRLIQNLGLVTEDALDPYHQNTYKGDRPICTNAPEEREYREAQREAAEAAGTPPPYGSARCLTPAFLGLEPGKWFFVANAISDTVIEPRTFPIPVGVQTTNQPHRLDVFGRPFSTVFSQTFIAGFALLKGSTAYSPPAIEYRLTLAYNVNHVDVPERRVLFVEPSRATHRTDHFLGVQEAFVDYHLHQFDTSRFDFISIRAGIQPFQSDFRGFLFNDSQLGIRLFGNRDNNRFQFNLAAFWRLEKDTNSGLNSVVQRPRDDFVFLANVYRQDFVIPALTSQVTVAYNRNREGNEVEIDTNGFPVRPGLLGTLQGRNYDVVYLGYNADGHIGRVNLTASLYQALGKDYNSFFTDRPARINARFAAAEASLDRDWMRFRLSAAWASGDGDPFDNHEGGYDAIFENPVFAGADTSYWIRQTIPFAGGGRVISLNGRNGILNSLRSSKEQGQSNFNNPGLMLVGAGADFDLSPEVRVSANANHLWFENTTTLQTLRVEGSIPRDIGFDLSTAATWRPHANQNIVARLSAATLLAGRGFRDLFASLNQTRTYVSVLANVTLSY